MNAIIESLNAWGARFAGLALPMLLQSAVLIALLFVLDSALRKRVRATIRYAVWMLALVKLALPPSLALPTGAAYWLPAKTAASYSALAAAPLAAAEEAKAAIAYRPDSTVPIVVPLAASSPRLAWPAVFFMVWLAVALGMGIWVISRWRLVAGITRQSVAAPGEAEALLESCRRQLGIKSVIPVRCAGIGSPAICGFLRPVILLPQGLAENLNGSELRSVLMHELAHYKRADLWVNHAQIVLQILYWYNPLLWLANMGIRRAREQAVDEMVLVEMGEKASEYPATLLHVAKLGMGRPMSALGLMGILEPGRGLTQRILHIMNRPLPRTARIGARGLAAVLLLALVALPMASRSKAEPAPQPASSESPKATAKPAKDELSLVISKDGVVFLQNEKVTLDELQKKLAEAVRQNPQATLNIRADREAPWNRIVRVMDAANAAGMAEGAHFNLFVGAASSKAAPPSFNPMMSDSAYREGQALWLKKVQDNPDSAAILGKAAGYFLLRDRSRAEDLLKKAQILEPRNPTWSEQLGQLYKLDFNSESATEFAAKALQELERAQAQTTPAVPGAPRLADMAQMAIAAGDLEKARAYANELLGPGMEWSGGGDAGRAFFYGNLVLGRVALREGKLDEAKKYLLEAGKTKGDPTLNSFGPNMSLAKELLEKGETNAVLEFFQECEKFWPQYAGENKMAKWTAEVKERKTPDFGANLFY